MIRPCAQRLTAATKRNLQVFFSAAADAVVACLERFKGEMVQHVHGACTDALAELDEVLFGVRDGIKADEAAETQTSGRCAPAVRLQITQTDVESDLV